VQQQQQQLQLQDTVDNLRSELERAHEAIGRLMPSQQHEQDHAFKERQLKDELQALRMQLTMQQQQAAADIQHAQRSFEEALGFLESRARATLGRMEARMKVWWEMRAVGRMYGYWLGDVCVLGSCHAAQVERAAAAAAAADAASARSFLKELL
jgi:chromosome segregation ATPase